MIERPILSARHSVLLGVLEQAALNGRRCPTNEDLCDLHGASASYWGVVLGELEHLGIISVTRFSHGREVEILGTGQRTAAMATIKREQRQLRSAGRGQWGRPDIDDDGLDIFRGDVPLDQYVDRDPCPRCAVRADVGCKHRPPSGTVTPAFVGEPDGRRTEGAGVYFNFKRRGR
jgi:hypothetical protein